MAFAAGRVPGEPPEQRLEVYEDATKNILAENDSPDIGFRWSVNRIGEEGTVESSPLLGRTTSSHATFKQVAARSTAYIPTLVFVLILVYVTAYQPYSNGPAIRSDGQGYHIWTFALKKWDFRFCEYAALGYAVPVDTGRCVVKWPPGVALFRFPVMTWFVDVNNHESFSEAEHWVSLVFGAGLTLAISIIGLRILKRIRLDPLESQAVLFILVFGTGLFHYGTYDNSFSHVYSAFGSTVLVWQLFRMRERGRVKAGAWDAALAGVVAFFMILFRNTNVLIVLFYMVLVASLPTSLWTKGRVLIGAGIGTALGAAIQLSYNHYVSGHFSVSSYLGESFVWDRPMVRSVLFSFERGLFTYYPVVLFALVLGLWRRVSRVFTSALLLLVLVYATLYGFWQSWFLGGGFGHRGFIELVPWMLPAIGLALADIKDRVVRHWILVVASLTLFVPLQVMVGYWRGSFPFQRIDETVYWAHLFGGVSGFYLIAAAVALFASTYKLQSDQWLSGVEARRSLEPSSPSTVK